ncbi:DoxX-like family protein [Geomicrobium sp. JCM 19055]
MTLALLWAYQGLIPKLLFPETGELDLIAATGL